MNPALGFKELSVLTALGVLLGVLINNLVVRPLSANLGLLDPLTIASILAFGLFVISKKLRSNSQFKTSFQS